MILTWLEEEGDCLLRKPLSAAMPNYVSEVAASNKNGAEKSDTSCDVNDNEGMTDAEIGTVSIDGSCKGKELGMLLVGSV